MEGVPSARVDLMGELNNTITEQIDKSPCTVLEILFVLNHIEASLGMLVLAPKKPS